MCVRPSMSAKRMAPGERAATGETQIGSFPRVRPLMLRQRLVPREGCPAVVANIRLRLYVHVLFVFFHIAELRKAFPAHGAEMWFLSRVDQPVSIQILAGVKSFPADNAFVRPLPRVAPHVSFKPLRAGEAAIAQGAFERLLPCVRADVSAELRGLEEAHPAIRAAVRLLRLLLVGLFVGFAVARLGESLPADRADEGPLPGVHSLMTDELVVFTECLHAERTLVRLLWFLRVCPLVPLQLERPVKDLPTVGTGVHVGPAVVVLVSDQLLLLREALLAMLTLIQNLGLP